MIQKLRIKTEYRRTDRNVKDKIAAKKGIGMENQKTALISVIVPVYNVEKYLERCIQSLLIQTYSNIEILIIDDCSTDHSAGIGKALQKKDDRIKCLSYPEKGHRGLSAARNLGIKKAAGEYIVFIDADDFIKPLFIEILYHNLIENNADISVCSYEKIKEKKADSIWNKMYIEKYEKHCNDSTLDAKKAMQPDDAEVEITTGKQMLAGWYQKYFAIETVVWNKLYRKKIFEQEYPLRFEEGRIFEDVEFSLLAMQRAAKVAISSDKLYFYIQRNGSIQESYMTCKKIKDSLQVQEKRIAFLKKYQYEAAAKRCATDYEKYTIRYYFLAKETGQKKKVRAYVTKCFLAMYAFAISGKEVSIRDRLILIFFKNFIIRSIL